MIDYDRLLPQIIRKGENDISALNDAFQLCRELEREDCITVCMPNGEEQEILDENNQRKAHIFNRDIRKIAKDLMPVYGDKAVRQYRRSLLFDAPIDFDAYCTYIELDRAKEKKFYLPRRPQLLPLVEALQQLETGELEILGISMPPGTGKTALAIFYLTWISGRRPDLQSLVGSHNNDFLRGLYDECKRIMMPGGEYLWADVFPGLKISGTNAKDLRIDLGKPKRFQTLEMTSIGSGNAGKVRATHLLYCDDLVEGIEQAMSRDQMEKLWQKYTVDLRQRKQGDVVKELHIATRWSLIDPIGRLENIYGNDGKRALFINIPALDEDGNSNFNYPYGVGFTTEMYNDLKQSMDDASWRALYMGSPIEREGQLYPPDELRRYFELPEGEPDAVYAVADTKDTGADYFCMPVVYQYGNDYYVEEILCDNGRMEAVESATVEMLIKHKVKLARFESNRGGARSAEDVQSALDRQGGITHITTKYNTTNKETRIQVSQPWVKNHCVFKDESRYDRQYRTAMSFLCGYTMMGKNKFDDVPDAFADLADFVQGMGQRGKGIIMNRFF